MKKSIAGDGTVKHREVLYIAGFDPRGASTYHKLTTDEFAKHCVRNTLNGSASKRQMATGKPQFWTLTADRPTGVVTSQLTFLSWDQMVRARWIRRNAIAILSGARYPISRTGWSIQRRIFQKSWPIAITMFGPLFVVLATVAVVLALAMFATITVAGAVAPGLIGLFLTLAAAALLKKKLAGFNAPWIGRIAKFIFDGCNENFLAEWDRPDEMADAILVALQNPDNDEVLIVSHSVGTLVALLVFEKVLLKDRDRVAAAVDSGRLVFVTLGQTNPLMSFESTLISNALKSVGDSPVPWLDVSAPTDPASFAMVDSFQDRFGGAQRIHVRNAQFFKNFKPSTFKNALRNRFTMHFLYLMAPDGDGTASFDFYDFLASPTRLADRLPVTPQPTRGFYSRGPTK